MQIYFTWTCRACGEEPETMTDTANYPAKVPLTCGACKHTSGIVTPFFTYLEEHRPPHEREELSAQ
jgi:hypothetical protein